MNVRYHYFESQVEFCFYIWGDLRFGTRCSENRIKRNEIIIIEYPIYYRHGSWKVMYFILFNLYKNPARQVFVIVHSVSHVTHGRQHSRLPCPSISWSLLKLMSIESVMPSNHLVLCHPFLLLLSIFSSIRSFLMSWLFTSGGQNIGVSALTSSEYSGLISFRIDWCDLFAVQGTLKSLLQYHSSKASILWHSAFFMVQPTSIHDYGKNHSFDYTNLCWQSGISAS